tara:strand:- start:401 stop:1312 length:912 start_codon:yes stop_codon:yes gene_type:complete
MKLLLVGYGNQGKKREKVFKQKIISIVDKYSKKIKYNSIYEVPLSDYDAAICSVPDGEKFEIINYLINNNKHVMVEKPFNVKKLKKLDELNRLCKKNKTCCYVAYNHRFEPSILRAKKILNSGILGKIYFVNFFYGNGTSLDVKKSPWKDKGNGVTFDLGSHLIDLIYFFFNKKFKFKKINIYKHENKTNDHSYFFSRNTDIKINCEVNLLTWKNNCKFEIVGKNGSLTINSLQKWGGSDLILQKRIFPSGKPIEKKIKFMGKDPTWELEGRYFLDLIKQKKIGNLQTEIKIIKNLKNIVKNK